MKVICIFDLKIFHKKHENKDYCMIMRLKQKMITNFIKYLIKSCVLNAKDKLFNYKNNDLNH